MHTAQRPWSPGRLRRCACMLALLLPAGAAHAFNETLTNGTNRDLSAFAGDAGGADGFADFQITGPAGECSSITKFTHANGSARAFPSTFNYAGMSYAEAIGQSYGGTGPFCPSDGDLYYVKTSGVNQGSSADDRFYKLRINSNTSGGANVDYEYLGTGIPSPPESSFSFSTYDLFGLFTDTSTGSASSWSWSFGDGSGTSTQQNPRYRYLSAGNRTVMLTASNVGGADPTPAAQSVAVSERPSISTAVGGTLDLDSDGTADLQAVAGSCNPATSHLETRNGASVEMLGEDYRTIDAGDIAGAAFGATNFCMETDYLQGFLVRTGDDDIYKAWIARNDGSGVRLEVALLQSGGPPPPVTAFSFSSYDLIVDFEDDSTGAPTSWDWDFGDGASSTAQNPRHRYASAATRSACLTAGNIGGDGLQECQDVTVAPVPSTTVAVGSSFDFNADGIPDLSVQSAGGACGATVNSLATQNLADYVLLSEDYRGVTPSDALGANFGTGTFCVEVDYLDAFLVRTSTGETYRAWTAGNDAGGVRIESALLVTIPPVIFADGFE